MQKWEYCAITGIYYDTKEGWLSTGYHKRSLMLFKEANVYAERIEDNPKELAKIIVNLGKEGWEMVGCGTVAMGYSHILYFKRPKVDVDIE
jgi:hypothetical protein